MSVDYIVSSLPALAFGAPAPISWEKFCEIAGVEPDDAAREQPSEARQPKAARAARAARGPYQQFEDLETQLRNAVAEARSGGEKWKRPVKGCSLYWKKRVFDCFAEKDVAKRDELLDRVWWDAAGELTPPADPLGKGALATYAIRLRIALKRGKISVDAGNAAFDRLTAASKITFEGKESSS